MSKKIKISLYFLMVILVPVLLVSAFLSNQKNKVSAQEFTLTRIVCDEPIPTGEAVEESLKLMTEVYSELQNVRSYLSSAIEQTQSEVSELYKNPEEVCDFSACQPQVIDQAPDFSLKIKLPFKKPKPLVGFHIPLCPVKECIGEPCPDLEDYYKFLETMKGGVEGTYEKVSDIFSEKKYKVTEDIRKEGESVGELIRWPEFVRRKLDLAREWLHSAAEKGKRSCSLSEIERKKVEAGELGARYPMRCSDALAQGVYWPKPWSESCRGVCEKGPIDDCKDCLGQKKPDEEASPLAKINYRIYGTCKKVCGQGKLTQDCIDCLCCDEPSVETSVGPFGIVAVNIECKKRLSEEECIAWICGGSYYNYVCCHETTLERE